MVINGPMAAVVDITSGATLDFSCTDYQVSLGGGGQGKLLLHRSMLSAAGILPDQWLGTAWGQLVVFQNFNQAAGLPDSGLETAPFNPAVHPPRMGQQPGALQTLPISMNQTSANYLLITNIMPTYRQFQVSGVQANGQPATLLVANAANRLYHCRHCQSGTINWQFELTTNDVSAIDINGFSHDRP